MPKGLDIWQASVSGTKRTGRTVEPPQRTGTAGPIGARARQRASALRGDEEISLESQEIATRTRSQKESVQCSGCSTSDGIAADPPNSC